jgi:hypothetical protein
MRIGCARKRRAIGTTPYEQLAISDVFLQEIGLLLHSGKLTVRGSPGTVLAGLLDYVTVLPITLDIAINSIASSPPRPKSTDCPSSPKTATSLKQLRFQSSGS